MIKINCYGQKEKVVNAALKVEVTFLVGGEDNAERIKAVFRMLIDEYDRIVGGSFLREGITGLYVQDISVDDEDTPITETENTQEENK